jgi:molybdopterin/thiamine biosynthesis adenylyltransferase
MIYFNRQINLLGEQNQKNLKNKSIAIIGCGGLGCTIATALSGSGIGTIYLIDFDKIEIHNIHRQIAFKLDDIDKYKCEALANSCKQRVEYSQFIPLVKTFDEFINEGLCVDLIIDATDNLETRSKIDKYCKLNNIPWIYGSVEEFNGQVAFFDKVNFDEVFNIQEPVTKSQVAPMVMQIASFQSNLALRFLANLPIKKDKLYYIYYNDEGELIQHSFGF